jgi:hypothetical protein
MRLPTRAAWTEWRASLPPVPDYKDFYDHRGTKYAMRAALAHHQGQRCATCMRRGLPMVLDHEHFTGLARGMLCRGCNVREGSHFGVDHAVFRLYRANPPAFGAGWIWDCQGYAGRIMFARAKAGGKYSISCVADADLANMSYEVISAMTTEIGRAWDRTVVEMARARPPWQPG